MNFPLYHPGFQPKSPTSLADHRIETIAPICITCSLSMDSCEELVLFRITGFVRHLSSHALPTQIHISYIICQLTYLPCVHACVLKHFCIHPCSRKTLSLGLTTLSCLEWQKNCVPFACYITLFLWAISTTNMYDGLYPDLSPLLPVK